MKSYFMDPYVRCARLQPALLVALPLALAVLAGFRTRFLSASESLPTRERLSWNLA